MSRAARRVLVFGVVQGVGFRPFIHKLARRLDLRGWVRNAAGGVEIHVEGASPALLDTFARAVREEKPPLAVIESLTESPSAFEGRPDFEIRTSAGGDSFVFIAPDIAACPACLAEVADPRNRRFAYPFTNCTDCGPRYTIVRNLPYDRPQTTMAGFPMCAACAAEYHDPADRRYHAQPIACPVCGPRVRLRPAGSDEEIPGGLAAAAERLKQGRIVAVKGLGGFHLMADPFSPAAVRRLRAVKERRRKPLALMALDLQAVRRIARATKAETELLLSPRRPIVLLRRKAELPGIAPNLGEVGVMLAYTPLHVLLLRDLKLVVATSSNPKDAPIITDGREGLDGLCDFILDHDRPIHMRADDSVVKAARGGPLFARRARGYVPAPQAVPEALRSEVPILALGGELKDTVTIYRNGYAVTSQFLGDLDEYRNHRYFEETAAHLQRLFGVLPARVVSDLHPDFQTTRWAERLSGRLKIPHDRVQHHHAHVLAVLLEHGIGPGNPVLGLAWDGFGYGADGTPWGGEFLLADYDACRRFARFEPLPLPGGDRAAKEPWRMALSLLHGLGLDRRTERVLLPRGVPARSLEAVRAMIARGVHAPPASSAGRLFDAVSALAGTAPLENEFEAEAAMRLEAAAAHGRARAVYPLDIDEASPRTVSFKRMAEAIVRHRLAGVSPEDIAATFHRSLATLAVRMARLARREAGLDTVVLCGGVFLNRILLESTTRRLEAADFRVLRPLAYSPNDEAVSLGQAAFALGRARAERLNRSG
jgi:hydrogenase maturation protein HypF